MRALISLSPSFAQTVDRRNSCSTPCSSETSVPSAKLNVEGYELDFALLEQGIKLNIEADGDQHLDARGRQRRQDITRDRVLSKLGWTVLRIPAWRCHEEIDLVIDEIEKTRDRLLAETSSQKLLSK